MPTPTLSILSRKNPRVQELRRLKKSQERRKQGRFLLEGPKFLASALAAGALVHEVWIEDSAIAEFSKLLDQLEALSIPWIQTSPAVLEALATTPSPQGVLAVLEEESLKSIPPALPNQDLLVLADVQDPGNLGALWRTAAAAGIRALLIGDRGADPTSPKVLRSSAGVRFLVPHTRVPISPDLVDTLDGLGYASVSLAAHGNLCYTEVPFQSPTAIWVGAEGPGLPPEILARISTKAWIPMASGVESLNAAFAAGLLIYEGARRRGFPRIAPRDPPKEGDLAL